MAVKMTIKNGGMGSGILLAYVRWGLLLVAFAAIGITVGIFFETGLLNCF